MTDLPPDERDRLERLLRASLQSNAQDRPDPDALTDRVLARLADPGAQRRAGRRRFVRAGAPLIAAASVAAIVAAGLVGTAIVKHVQDGSHPAAMSHATEVAPTSPATTASPRPTVSHHDDQPSQSSATADPSVIPANSHSFRAQDLSFIAGGNTSFAVGSLNCPDTTPSCPGVIATSTEADVWRVVTDSAPFEVGTETDDVQKVRFSGSQIGYAFGPSAVYRTDSGGATWDRMDGGGAVGLEVNDDSVVKVSASSTACKLSCVYSVSTASLSSTSWKATALPARAAGTQAFLARTGDDVYFAASSTTGTTLFGSTDGGAAWKQRSKGVCAGDLNRDSVQLRALNSTTKGVIALCTGTRTANVMVSTSGGVSFGDPLPAPGAAASGAVAIASFEDGTILLSADRLYRTVRGKFVEAATDDGAANPSVVFLGTESENVAHWVCGNGSTVQTSGDTGAHFIRYDF